jgi:outer membrane protein assembly factor BamD (BamD/ComL family)
LPGSRLAEEAGMRLADFYFDRRQMALAAVAYELFIQNYPRSSQIDKARRRLIYSNLATFKGPEFGAAGLYEARDRLRQLQTQQPAEAQRMGADALLTRIDESDAQKLLSIARYYMDTGEPISAEFTIRRLTSRYPHSAATAEALRMVPEVLQQLPESVRRRTPDYAAMSAALLERGDARPATAKPASSSDTAGSSTRSGS